MARGRPKTNMTPSKYNRQSLIGVSINAKLRKRIERQAEEEGISLSAVMRRAVLRDLEHLDQSQRRLSA
jgi:cytidylate kinase